MPAQRPRASFEPISPGFDVRNLVESTANFSYVDRISCDMIEHQGMAAFEKLILLHVIVAGKPLVIDGFDERLDPWTFTPKWLRDNCGDKQENAWDLKSKALLPLTIAHYLKNMGMLTNQFSSKPDAYKDRKRQRVYLKDIDCPAVWQDKLREHIPSALYYLNESTGEPGGPGAVPESNVPGKRLGKGIARAGDLMSSLPPEMRAENLMCYIGHEGTFTPSHREMCASLGQNIMVEASNTVSDDGKPEKPGSSIWFMTESKDRHTVSEYWLSVLGHDIEIEDHFAQVVAWKKAPFNVYVVEQRPGDFILIPPLAPHQVWNRGTRTMKVAWNRTTVETLEMALNEALPRSRIVCRDEQYKNKAIVYYTLQKYSALLSLAQSQAAQMPPEVASKFLYTGKVKQLAKDFRRLFALYRQILLSEMFSPDERDTPKAIEYIPFDSNVTCAYCRSNIFNRFLTCPSCTDVLGHHDKDPEGDPYDVCMDCYVMGRSCGCISDLKWVEQFRWKELAAKYESWRMLIIAFDRNQVTDKTPLPLLDERRRHPSKTLAEVCKDQLKRRPWVDVHKTTKKASEKNGNESEGEEIVVNDDGTVKKVQKKRSKSWVKNNNACHVCKNPHPNWKMAQCTTCERWWCYGTLFRGWDKMPMDIMADPDWSCPHCLGVCFAGTCKRGGDMVPYEPKGTLLGHDTRKVADVRSVEALVDFSVSNLNWLKDDDPENRADSRRLKRAGAEAENLKAIDPMSQVDDEDDHDDSQAEAEPLPSEAVGETADERDVDVGEAPADEDEELARRLMQANAALALGGPAIDVQDGYAPAGYRPSSDLYPQPGVDSSYTYPGYSQDVDSGRQGQGKRHREEEDPEDINMNKQPKMKKPRLVAAGFRSTDLADELAPESASKAKSEAQRQFEREKERKALEKAKAQGRFIIYLATLKGKKLVVKLKVPVNRLENLLAQQAAKAALATNQNNAVDEDDGQHADGGEEPDDDMVLLKSDIAPVAQKQADWRKVYEQRQREGRIINSTSKKARVPVEKDANYSTHLKQKAPESGQRRKERLSEAKVDFEEVDIGSDEDAEAGTFTKAYARNRRSLPGYRRNRHTDDNDEDFPEALPDNFKISVHGTSPNGRARRTASAASAPSTVTKPAENGHSVPVSPPATSTNGESNGRGNTGRTLSSNKPKGRPQKNGSLQPKVVSSPPMTKQDEIAEQNRLAKLQALEMFSAELPSASPSFAAQSNAVR